MQDADIARIAQWLIARGLAGGKEDKLLEQFCRLCREAGLMVSRGLLIMDTLHPVYEGRAFVWRQDGTAERAVIEYGSSFEGAHAETWRRTAFYHLLQTGGTELRRRIAFGDPLDFSILTELREAGQTDYFVLIRQFSAEGSIGEMDGFYSQWTSAEPEGFTEDDIAALRRLVPVLALALKCETLTGIAGTVAEIYLGRDAGRLVMSGRIARGVAERIPAVLWFSDLRGYTRISDSAAPEEIIPLLNDYAGAVIGAVHEAGGTVLKLIGDGALALFRDGEPAQACAAALAAEASLRTRLAEVNARRTSEGRPVTDIYLGLHIGEVFYGNIGSDDRLDFTVVGPAVNEVARIASMCRSVDHDTVVSSEFALALPEALRARLVSVGRYALRGVGRTQHLYTLDPDTLARSARG
ncbi:adenylate/guanylate cyclase domain-containing protein [Ancylobacter terrae]|uniref:adenylate/guanylate cyclase domain-containing protein n=1 Tax=Ancylobacter sp. sgz301288 TaxID=3342077 RepID=UPI003859F0D3